MKILLIGGGGREHAIAQALSKSQSIEKIFSFPGNPGIWEITEKAEIEKFDFLKIADFCKSNSIDLVIVGPEKPLADGITDELLQHGIKVFGPSKMAARLESSKGFAKDFMARHNIPTAHYQVFSSNEKKEADEYLKTCKFPVVLKADGLAAGKGVIIADNFQSAQETLDSMFSGLFDEAGKTVVIEEFLVGEEASILAICDGKDYITLPTSQDHKRALDNDLGKNTGGMGAYSPAPIVTESVMKRVHETILIPAIEGMRTEGFPFVGCLYAGLMINNGKPKVVEFNVRFGDPETQSVLSIFEGDFAKLLYSAACGTLNKTTIKEISNKHSCCVIIASEGYPDDYKKGFEITGIEDAEKTGAIVYHSGTKLNEGNLISDGGRVFGVTGVSTSLETAIGKAYDAVKKIKFSNMYYRKDIGKKALK